MAIEVTENDDKTFTISWDENNPNEKIFNDFTAEDFINLIQNYLQSLQESGEIDINLAAEEIKQDIANAEKFIQDNYIQATNEETCGDQGNEQQET